MRVPGFTEWQRVYWEVVDGGAEWIHWNNLFHQCRARFAGAPEILLALLAEEGSRLAGSETWYLDGEVAAEVVT